MKNEKAFKFILCVFILTLDLIFVNITVFNPYTIQNIYLGNINFFRIPIKPFPTSERLGLMSTPSNRRCPSCKQDSQKHSIKSSITASHFLSLYASVIITPNANLLYGLSLGKVMMKNASFLIL